MAALGAQRLMRGQQVSVLKGVCLCVRVCVCVRMCVRAVALSSSPACATAQQHCEW